MAAPKTHGAQIKLMRQLWWKKILSCVRFQKDAYNEAVVLQLMELTYPLPKKISTAASQFIACCRNDLFC